jgi:hypothetical protein
MRRILVLCTAVAVATLAVLVKAGLTATAPGASGNLLINGNMESPREGHPWMPAGWDTSVSGLPSVFFGRDSFLVREGRFSLNVANASTIYPMSHNWHQMVMVTPDMWGKDAVLSVWSRSNGVEGRGYVLLQAYRDTISMMSRIWGVEREEARLRLNIHKVDDPLIDFGWKRVAFSEPETDWVRRDLRVYIAPTTHVLFVRLGIIGTGQVMFDDARLTIEPAKPAAPPPLMTNLLADPSFEAGGDAWEFSTPPFEGMHVGIVEGVARTGNRSVGLWGGLASVVEARAGACQVIPARNLQGMRVRLTSHVKTDSLRGLAYIKLYANTLSGVEHPPTPRQFSMDNDWTATSMEMDVPKDTYALWAWSVLNAPAPGRVYFDDMELVVLGPATGEP